MAIDAGRYDRQITIQQATVAQDTFGEPDETWATLAVVWAQVIPKTGREYFKADQRISEADTIFRIRYRSDITSKMRISYNNQFYNINGMAELGRQEALEIIAQVQGV